MGIDEDTAVIVHGSKFERSAPAQCAVADGSSISYTNATDPTPGRTLCLFDVRLHVLNSRATFDIPGGQPRRA